MLLSAELRDPVLGVWGEPEDCLSRLSAGSSKVDTVWVVTPSFRTWLLVSGKRSFLLGRMECKEEVQTPALGSAHTLTQPFAARRCGL